MAFRSPLSPLRLWGEAATAEKVRGASGAVSVGVFIDLERSPAAGGHVKSWERIAEAAVEFPDVLDLTVHFLGAENEVTEIAGNVRYMTHRPSFGTQLLGWLKSMPAQTDIAPLNFRVLRSLKDYDVIHTTDAYFAQAGTALLFAHHLRKPLVNSIHTDTPSYTRIFTAELIRKVLGNGWLSRLLLERLRLDERFERKMLRRLDKYLRKCDWILASRSSDVEKIRALMPDKKVSLLRRGIDKTAFHPRCRDRQKLRDVFGIPPGDFLLLYVGRLDAAKDIDTVARAARMLIDGGLPIHLMAIGEGNQKQHLQRLLGPHGTFPGTLLPRTLAWLYASADLFVFPSTTEVCPNVVLEAKSCGLPVIVSTRGGAHELVRRPGRDGILVEGTSPVDWARAIQFLRLRPLEIERMREEARRAIEISTPCWRGVLRNDLIPVWKAVCGRRPVQR
jgi:glycosyltransferase involved in cell wall biosynthesis